MSRELGRVLPDSLARSLPGVVPQPGARLTPQAQAELAAMGEEVETPAPEEAPIDTYRNARDLRAARTELGSLQNPVTGMLGTATGIGLSALAPLPAMRAGAGAGLLRRLGAAGLTGGAYGALTGLTDGRADLTRPSAETAKQLGSDVLTGAALGGGFGMGGAALGAAGRSLYQGLIKPTAAALYLRAKGVPLTTGQLNPKSWFSQMEEATTSVPVTGTAISGMRDRAKEGFQDVVMNEARAPGMGKLDPDLDHGEMLDEIRKGFNAAYAPAHGLSFEPRTSSGAPLLARGPRPPAPPLPTPANAQPPAAPAQGTLPGTPPPPAPAPGPDGKIPLLRDARGRFLPRSQQPRHGGTPSGQPAAPDASPEFGPAEGQPIFTSVVEDQSLAVSDKARNMARSFLDNQLTVLGDDAAKTGVASSDRLITIRSNIREEIRQHQNGDSDSKGVARLLKRAEEELTDIIDSGLTPEARAAVKEADAQYAKYKTAERAIASAGDQPDGFTPAQLSRAVRYGKREGEYARGGGGEMRSLAAAGRAVLDARVPVTGARLLAALPGASMFSLWGNLPGPQRFLTGQTRAQRALQSTEEALAQVLRRAPTESAVRGLLPEAEQPALPPPPPEQLMSVGRPAQVLTPEQRQQLALSEAIQRLQGGRR